MVNIADILLQWQDIGVFDFFLPFLLIFAVIFGVLTSTNILGPNKMVHVIVALSIALMSLQIGLVQYFFAEVFPRLGVGLAVILVIVILTALFIPDQHKNGWAIALYSIGGLTALIVIFNSFSALSWFNSTWFEDWGGLIIGGLLLVGVIIAVSVSSGGGSSGGAKSSGGGGNPTFGPWRN